MSFLQIERCEVCGIEIMKWQNEAKEKGSLSKSLDLAEHIASGKT
jgi:hypothetical protein